MLEILILGGCSGRAEMTRRVIPLNDSSTAAVCCSARTRREGLVDGREYGCESVKVDDAALLLLWLVVRPRCIVPF